MQRLCLHFYGIPIIAFMALLLPTTNAAWSLARRALINLAWKSEVNLSRRLLSTLVADARVASTVGKAQAPLLAGRFEGLLMDAL